MNKNRDEVQKRWESLRQTAIDLGEAWVEAMMKDYSEPERTGTPRGETIGLSLKKKKASLFMILHPTLSLREIAQKVGISEGVLRVWRTKEDFNNASMEACISFGEMFANTIDIHLTKEIVEDIRRNKEGLTMHHFYYKGKSNLLVLKSQWESGREYIEETVEKITPLKRKKIIIVDDSEAFFKRPHLIMQPEYLPNTMARLIPFFGPLTFPPFAKLIKEKSSWGIEYMVLGTFALQTTTVRNQKELKKWQERLDKIVPRRKFFESWLDVITNPESWKEYGEERMKESIRNFKEAFLDSIE